MRLRQYRQAMTSVLKKAVKLLSFLIICLSLWSLPTTSYAEVVQAGTDTVQMSGSDLQELVRQILENEAENKVLKEALESERASFSHYQQSVDNLFVAQAQEREAFTAMVKKLEKQLNRPRLELYGGYNTNDKLEGGVRLVWIIK